MTLADLAPPLLAAACAGWLALAASALVSAVLLRRQPQLMSRPLPPCSIIMPLCGCDAALADNLAALFSVGEGDAVQYILVAASADDPAWAAVAEAQRRRPAIAVQRQIAGQAPPGWLAKTWNLDCGVRCAAYEYVVFVDADVRLEPAVLTHVVLAAMGDAIGAAYACPIARGRGAGGRCDAAVTNFIALLAQPWLASLRRDALAGALWATRRARLDAIGGLRSVADQFADDQAIACRLRRSGYALACAPMPVLTVRGARSLRWFVRHQLRWLRTWRLAPGAPLGLALFFSPTLLAVLAAVADTRRWQWVAILYVAEVGLAAFVARRLNRCRRVLGEALLMPLALVLEQLVACGALCGRRVEWAGRRYRLHADGRFTALD